MNRQHLTVAVIPAYNEEANIAKVIRETKARVDKVIVCDDGSVDKTAGIAESSGAIVVRHEHNLGYGAALSTLFKKARKLNPDVIVTLDADGQHDPTFIPRLIEPILNNSTDVVIGSRFLSEGGQQNLPTYRKVGIRLITKLTKRAYYNGITDAQSGFRAYGKKAMQRIQPNERGMGASTEILIKAKQANLTVKEVPITISYEGNSSKQNPITHWLRVVLNTFKNASTRCPQIFYGVPSIVALVMALGFWIRGSPIYTKTGQTDRYIVPAAIGATVIGIALLTVTIILWKLVRASKETAIKKE